MMLIIIAGMLFGLEWSFLTAEGWKFLLLPALNLALFNIALVRGAEHAEPAVRHLVAVAVRVVQHVASPPLSQTRDVGELVAQAGRDQQAPRRYPAAVGQPH